MLSKVALSRVSLANGHTDGKYYRETVTFLFIFILLHSSLPGLFEMDSQALNIYYMYNIYIVCHYHRVNAAATVGLSDHFRVDS